MESGTDTVTNVLYNMTSSIQWQIHDFHLGGLEFLFELDPSGIYLMLYEEEQYKKSTWYRQVSAKGQSVVKGSQRGQD